MASNVSQESQKMIEENTISLIDILLILTRQLKIISFSIFVIVFIVNTYSFIFADIIFTSTSKVMSSSSSASSMSQTAGLAAQFGISLPMTNAEPKWAYTEILKSRNLARLVLNKEFKINNNSQKLKLLEIMTMSIVDEKTPKNEKMAIGIEQFLESLNINEDIKNGIITINFSSSDPVLSYEVNKLVIEELDNYQKDFSRAKAYKTKIFIESRIKSTEKELMELEENLKVFRDRNRRIENSPLLQLEQQRLAREVTVLTGVFTTLKQQLETTKIEEVRESDYVIILDPPEVPLFKSSPKRAKVLVGSLAFGFFIGIIFGFLKDYLENCPKEQKKKINKLKKYLLDIMNLSSLKKLVFK